jgi:hypothetical protein
LIAAESHRGGLGEKFSPRHNNDNNREPTATEIIEELGDGILELGGCDKENLLLGVCLGLLESLGAAIEREVEEKVQSVLVKKLDHLTDICKGIQKTTAEKLTPVKPKPSYADIAAVRPPLTLRPILRTRIDSLNESLEVDILTKVKKAYNYAIAIYKLLSGDIDIRFDTQAHRDAVAGMPSPLGITVFNKQYLVEIPSVLVTIGVRNHQQADNNKIYREIERASVKSCGTFRIKSIRWLHDPEKVQKAQQEGRRPKTRGSLILGVASEAEQKSIVQGGVVIGGEYYAARFFESALVYKQCFRCGRWGHKQGACVRKPACLQCAGPHDTRTCKEDRVLYRNCGKGHRAWQREPYLVFQQYREAVTRRRATLLVASEACRSPNWHPASRAPEIAQVHVETQGRKRAAISEANEAPRRGVGRPRHIEVAAREASQSRLVFGRARPTESDESEDNIEE